MRRVGTFFILISVILILLFISTDFVKSPYYGYLLLGVLSLLIGIGLHITAPSKEPPPPSDRFRMLKKKDK